MKKIFVILLVFLFDNLHSQVITVEKYDYWNLIYSYDDTNIADYINARFKDSLNGILINSRLKGNFPTKGFTIEKTENAGNSWNIIKENETDSATIFIVDYKDDNILALLNTFVTGNYLSFADSTFIYISNDNGNTWNCTMFDLYTESSVFAKEADIKIINDSTYYFYTSKNFMITYDFGRTWINLYEKFNFKAIFNVSYIDNILYVLASKEGQYFFKSKDLAKSFQPIYTDSTITNPLFSQACILDSLHAYIILNEFEDQKKYSNLYYSDNGFESWQLIDFERNFSTFKISSGNDILILGKTQDDIYLFNKKGNLINKISSPEFFDNKYFFFNEADIINENLIYMTSLYYPAVWKYDKVTTGFKNENKFNINIFPNPLRNGNRFYINIKNNFSTKSTLLIHDISGKEVYKEKLNNLVIGNYSLEVKAKNLKTGVYMISIVDEKSRVFSEKLIIE